uniref:Uncharacterized protein n=1 Tax=viral metagenome TaxID=1070528 RepID=A0A6C0H811_9ZZZZ
MCTNYNKLLNEAKYEISTELTKQINKLHKYIETTDALDAIYYINQLIKFLDKICNMQIEYDNSQQELNEERNNIRDSIYKLVGNWKEQHEIEDPEINILFKEKSLQIMNNKLIEKVLLLLNNNTTVLHLNPMASRKMLRDANLHSEFLEILLKTKKYDETQQCKLHQQNTDKLNILTIELNTWRRQYYNINQDKPHNTNLRIMME